MSPARPKRVYVVVGPDGEAPRLPEGVLARTDTRPDGTRVIKLHGVELADIDATTIRRGAPATGRRRIRVVDTATAQTLSAALDAALDP